MDKETPVKLNEARITAIESILAKGDRVELIPVNGGVRIMRVRREEIAKKESSP